VDKAEKSSVIELRLDQIETEGQEIREEIDWDHAMELASSISQIGLLQPIVVGITPSGHYRLLAGRHRLEAAKKLGWERIPANLRQLGEDESQKGIAVCENIIRKQLSLEEEVNAICELYHTQKKSPDQICQLTGKGRAWVMRRLAIPGLAPNVREALLDNQITLEGAEIIQGVENEGIRNSILNEAIYARRTARELREMASIITESPGFNQAVEAGIQAKSEIKTASHGGKPCEGCGTPHPFRDLAVFWLCHDCTSGGPAAESMEPALKAEDTK